MTTEIKDMWIFWWYYLYLFGATLVLQLALKDSKNVKKRFGVDPPPHPETYLTNSQTDGRDMVAAEAGTI